MRKPRSQAWAPKLYNGTDSAASRIRSTAAQTDSRVDLMLQLLALLVYPSKNNQRISRAVSKNPRSLDQAQLQRANVHKRFLLRFFQDQENDSSKNKTMRAEKHKSAREATTIDKRWASSFTSGKRTYKRTQHLWERQIKQLQSAVWAPLSPRVFWHVRNFYCSFVAANAIAPACM